jgi:hypothetical protein
MQQTLEELDFERGLWGAASRGDVERIKTLREYKWCVRVL